MMPIILTRTFLRNEVRAPVWEWYEAGKVQAAAPEAAPFSLSYRSPLRHASRPRDAKGNAPRCGKIALTGDFKKKWKPVSFFLAGPDFTLYRYSLRKVGTACL
jgi:hypothetical protein